MLGVILSGCIKILSDFDSIVYGIDAEIFYSLRGGSQADVCILGE